MRETRLSGSVEGVVSNHDPYSDWKVFRDASTRRRSVSAVVLIATMLPLHPLLRAGLRC